MSKYGEYQTIMRDPALIAAALEALGCISVESHAEPVSITGYDNDSRAAHIVVRQRSVRGMDSLGDVGFLKQADGTYRLIADDYYPQELAQWAGRVKQEYTIARQMAVGRSKGYVYQGRETTEKGEVRLRFGVR